jgi:hypothetical protein
VISEQSTGRCASERGGEQPEGEWKMARAEDESADEPHDPSRLGATRPHILGRADRFLRRTITITTAMTVAARTARQTATSALIVDSPHES